ncbi:hypothetical protein BH09GEM1_BH09GEM1_14410 [soil metagenome]
MYLQWHMTHGEQWTVSFRPNAESAFPLFPVAFMPVMVPGTQYKVRSSGFKQ